jgi:hypothetical protein
MDGALLCSLPLVLPHCVLAIYNIVAPTEYSSVLRPNRLSECFILVLTGYIRSNT